MFDLEMRVSAWREAQSLPDGVVAELEEHLRSGVEDLTSRGLLPEEAFLVAARRLGSPSQLDTEFEKVPAIFAGRRLRWLVAGVLLALLVPRAVRLVARAGALVGVEAGVPERLLPWIVVGGGLAALALAVRVLVRMSADARAAVVGFVEGAAGTRGSRLRMGALVLGIFLAVSAATFTLSIGMTRLAPASATGWTAIGNNILGFLLSITLVVGSVILLTRRPPAPA